MSKCKVCGTPLTEKGERKRRSEHYLCRMFRKTKKKSVNVIEMDGSDFNLACKALDRNPELINKLFL